MPDIRLFVVSIENLQQQGIELSPKINQILPCLITQIINLLSDIRGKNKIPDKLPALRLLQ